MTHPVGRSNAKQLPASKTSLFAQLSPHISGERERLRQRTVLTYAFDEPINQRPQPRFGHVGDQIVEQLDDRGTLEVLRHGVAIIGLKASLALAQFKPALGMNAHILAPLRRQPPPSRSADPLFKG